MEAGISWPVPPILPPSLPPPLSLLTIVASLLLSERSFLPSSFRSAQRPFIHSLHYSFLLHYRPGDAGSRKRVLKGENAVSVIAIGNPLILHSSSSFSSSFPAPPSPSPQSITLFYRPPPLLFLLSGLPPPPTPRLFLLLHLLLLFLLLPFPLRPQQGQCHSH